MKLFGIEIKAPRITAESIRTVALFMAAPLFGGLLAWQLYGLEPERVCKTSFDLASIDGAGILTAFQACIGLYAKALDIKDHAVIGLLSILGLGYIMMLMRELRLQGSFKGPMGLGASLSDADKAPPAPLDGSAPIVSPPTASPQYRVDPVTGSPIL